VIPIRSKTSKISDFCRIGNSLRISKKAISPLLATSMLLFAGISIGVLIIFGTQSIYEATAFEKPKERPSPFNHIKEDQIKVFANRVRLDIDNPSWSRFAATKSMDPTIDEGANGIEIKPKSRKDLHVGDIVAYNSEYTSVPLAHRIIEIAQDSEGWYAILKGDNNLRADPGRIRFHQIETIIVTLIY